MYDTYVPDFDVVVKGLTLASDVRSNVLEVSYDNNIDTADMFRIQLYDPGMRMADSALFSVGKTVEIHMGYVGRLKPMMLGEITALEPSFPSDGPPTLSVSGYDKSHRMRNNKPCRPPFLIGDDSLIAAEIAALNLLIPVVDPSPRMPQTTVLQDCSDFALLKKLAARNGFEVFVSFDKLYFRFPRPQLSRIVLEWGKSLSSFSPRLSTSGQAAIQVIRSYNQELAQEIVAVLPTMALMTDFDQIFERIGGDIVRLLTGMDRQMINDVAIDTPIDAALLAKVLLQQMLDGLYEGSGTCPGNPDLKAGDQVEIRGVGKRFSGAYKLRKVTHTINSSGYQTQFEVTQKHRATFLQSLREKLVEKPSPNEPEKVEGVVFATVVNNLDPLGLGRVQVTFPHLSEANLSGWARVATLFAGNMAGTYFVPDIGDEVLVIFEQGDLQRPVVLGGLWSLKRRPPISPLDIGKPIQIITTKMGHQITLDDTPGAGKVVIADESGNKITLDDTPGAGKVVIADESGNKITLSKAGMELSAKGPLKLSGTSIDLSASASDVGINGANVKVVVKGTMDVSPPAP